MKLTDSPTILRFLFKIKAMGDCSGTTKLQAMQVHFRDRRLVVMQASCGGTHTMVLSNEGRIFVWGRGSFGRLGSGTEKDHYSPVEVFLPGMPCALICRWQIILADRLNTRLRASTEVSLTMTG